MTGRQLKWEMAPRCSQFWPPKQPHLQGKNCLWSRALLWGPAVPEHRAQICLDGGMVCCGAGRCPLSSQIRWPGSSHSPWARPAAWPEQEGYSLRHRSDTGWRAEDTELCVGGVRGCFCPVVYGPLASQGCWIESDSSGEREKGLGHQGHRWECRQGSQDEAAGGFIKGKRVEGWGTATQARQAPP